MPDFHRADPRFSLCGLNCGLCLMYVGGHCPGCGGGNRACALARCAQAHGAVEYCFLCHEYPCKLYEGRGEWDTVSFITSQRRGLDLARAREMGAAAYLGELGEKMDIFQYLLHTCNDGRRKSLFALAANLLPLEDLRRVRSDLTALDAPLSLRAREAARLLDEAARARGIALRLRKKPPQR